MRKLVPTILLSCLIALAGCDAAQVGQMNAQQVSSVDDATLCRTQVSMWNSATVTAESQRRNLNCNAVWQQNYNQANQALNTGVGGSGPIIQNSTAPVCEGLSIASAGEGLYSGIVPGMYVDVENSNGSRKWIQADIKYAGEVHTALQNTADEWWETTQPLITREPGTARFWVKSNQGTGISNLRMVTVRVIGCGT